MKILAATSVVAVMVAATAFGQSAKPSPYEGVSHPPDDAIVTNDLTPTAPPSIYSAETNTNSPSVSQPTAHMEAAPTSPRDHDYVQHPGLVSRPADTLDADVVTSPEQPHQADDSGIVVSVPSAPNQLPEGTTLMVSLNQSLSTATTQPGTIFSARLLAPVMKNNRIVIPVGSTVTGRVTSVSEGRRITGGASIRLRPDEVVLPDGTRYFLHAEVYDLGNSRTVKPGTEGNVVNVAHGKRTVAEASLFGGGAAAAGFMIAGGPAALVLGGAAAGYVGAHWLLESKQAVLPKDSQVVFGLTQPMSLVSFHE
ncbi:MAG TPA: hypothetical protein VFN62_14835 [Acidobacteriaceae bacterium]|nr:hypothetical protein [Acidobacteriaceae bacterium]